MLPLFQWIPEITSHCKKTPFILIGTQIDLRGDSTTNKQLSKCDKKPITSEQGWNLTRELGGVKYLECSALTQVIIYILLLTSFYEYHWFKVITWKPCILNTRSVDF